MTKRSKVTYSATDYVGHIVSAFNNLVGTESIVGERWYRRMMMICAGHAIRLGTTPQHVAAIFAAYSINTDWSVNLKLAAQFLRGRAPYRNTLSMCIDKAQRIMSLPFTATLDDIDMVLSPDADTLKIKDFTRCNSGDYSIVVVDRWACAIAYGWQDCPFNGERACSKNKRGHACKNSRVPKGDEYRAIAEAYSIVARQFNVQPAMLQAMLWVAARRRAN